VIFLFITIKDYSHVVTTIQKKISSSILSIALFLGFDLLAIDQAVQVIEFSKQFPRPWFTGPLLCPSGYVVPVGHINVQPYYYLSYSSGYYSTSWKSEPIKTLRTEILQIPFKFGVVKKMDFGLVPQVTGQHRKNQSSWGISDCVVSAGFQILNAKLEDPWPALRLGIRGTLPLGKYKNLDPKKLRTDIHGTGNYFPSVGVVGTKLYHLTGIHYLEFRLASFYAFSTHVSIKGQSLYNSIAVKRGTVHPGDLITATFAMQYNITKQMAFACDVFYKHQNKAKYIGPFKRSDPIVQENKISSDNFSLAPALEYNFSENLGLIGGCWLSIAGRNSLDFTSGVISLNSYF
jgi:hypothetical protein